MKVAGALMFFLSVQTSHAQPNLTVISNDFESYDPFEYDVSEHLYAIPSSSGKSHREALALSREVMGRDIPVGPNDWRVLHITNQSSVEDFSLRFMVRPRRVNVAIYDTRNDQVKEDSLGLYVMNPDPGVRPRLMTHEFLLHKGDTLHLLYKGDFTDDPSPHLTLSQAKHARQYTDQMDRLSFMFSAIFMIMLFYNLSILFIVGNKAYAHYCVLALGYFLHAINYQFEQWIIPIMASQFFVVSGSIIVIGWMGFWRSFLHIQKGLWFNVSRVITVFAGCLLLFTLIGIGADIIDMHFYEWTSLIAALLALTAILSWLISSPVFAFQGVTNARLFFLSNIPLAVGGFIFLGALMMSRFAELTLGIYEILIVNYALFGGLAIQMVLFSVVIGYSIKRAATAQLESEQQQRELLEVKVRERTALLKMANDETNRKNSELELVNKTKSRLLTILSHDLRSPINNMSSLIELIREHQFNAEEMNEILPPLQKSISDTTEFMALLIAWTQSQNSGMNPNKDTFDLGELIAKCVDLLSPSAKSKKLKVGMKIGIDMAYGDKNMIDLVLRNLITNAIKFSEQEGEIQITTSLTDNNTVKVSVRDFGIGMDEERQRSLFDVTRKVSTVGTAGEKGFGMGLILCKDFVELNDGTLGFESEKGAGSTFWFEIPHNSNGARAI